MVLIHQLSVINRIFFTSRCICFRSRWIFWCSLDRKRNLRFSFVFTPFCFFFHRDGLVGFVWWNGWLFINIFFFHCDRFCISFLSLFVLEPIFFQRMFNVDTKNGTKKAAKSRRDGRFSFVSRIFSNVVLFVFFFNTRPESSSLKGTLSGAFIDLFLKCRNSSHFNVFQCFALKHWNSIQIFGQTSSKRFENCPVWKNVWFFTHLKAILPEKKNPLGLMEHLEIFEFFFLWQTKKNNCFDLVPYRFGTLTGERLPRTDVDSQ